MERYQTRLTPFQVFCSSYYTNQLTTSYIIAIWRPTAQLMTCNHLVDACNVWAGERDQGLGEQLISRIRCAKKFGLAWNPRAPGRALCKPILHYIHQWRLVEGEIRWWEKWDEACKLSYHSSHLLKIFIYQLRTHFYLQWWPTLAKP